MFFARGAIIRELMKGPRRPRVGGEEVAPNWLAQVSVLCALTPLAALAFLTVLSQMSGELFLALRGAGTTGVSVVVLGGTLCGALAGRAYWLDVRRGGLLLLTVGLLGCGIWAVYFSDFLEATIGLFG